VPQTRESSDDVALEAERFELGLRSRNRGAALRQRILQLREAGAERVNAVAAIGTA
jgi:hypothetical protein